MNVIIMIDKYKYYEKRWSTAHKMSTSRISEIKCEAA